jgi:hypothetical protein
MRFPYYLDRKKIEDRIFYVFGAFIRTKDELVLKENM